MATTPFVIRARPAYQPSERSPELPDSGVSLQYSTYPAVDEAGEPAVALFASGLVSAWHEGVYGGRLAGAVQIVAIDADRGSVYWRNAEHGKPVPLPLAMNPRPQNPSPGVAEVESAEVYFALDIRRHLRLPAHAARSFLFLWLDEITSLVQSIELPGPPPPQPERPSFSQTTFGLTAQALESPGGTLPALAEHAGRVHGAVSGSGPSVLLGLDFRSRQLKSSRIPFIETATISYEFDPLTVFGPPGWLDSPDSPRRAFLLAHNAGALSPLVIVNAP
jgi:hypothetical protein